MSRPSITHVISTPSGIGGAEKILVALAEGAVDRGFRYTVLNPFDRDPTGSDLRRELPPGTYRACSLPVWKLGRARGWVLEQLEESRPQVVHVQLAHAMVLVASLKRRFTVPALVSHQHGALFAATRAPIRLRIDRWATRRFDVVVAVSGQVKSFLTDEYGIDPALIEMIPNGWDGEPLPHSPDPRLTVVSVGRLRAEKGHGVLVESFASVARSFPDARLVLVGDGPERSALLRRVNELGIQENVDFVGAQDNVWPFLASASLFALPSFSETSGIAAMESMAAGVPVVASGVGGLRELVLPRENGVLVPPNDSEALSRELIGLLRSTDERVRMGARAKEMADDWRIERTVASYLSLYEKIVS